MDDGRSLVDALWMVVVRSWLVPLRHKDRSTPALGKAAACGPRLSRISKTLYRGVAMLPTQNPSLHTMHLYVDSTYASPFAMSAFVALWEKGVDFKVRPIDLQRKEHLRPPYSSQSLTMKLPMLVDGAFILTESSAIAEYVDETCEGPRLYPVETKPRARTRQIQSWLRSDFALLRHERPAQTIFRPTVLRQLSAEAQVQCQTLFAAAFRWLGDDGHVSGDWSIADVDLAVMLARLIKNRDPVPSRLVRYTERQWERSSVRAWLDVPR